MCVLASSSVGRFYQSPSFAAAAATPRVDVEKDPHAAAPAAACIVSSEIEVLSVYVCTPAVEKGLDTTSL